LVAEGAKNIVSAEAKLVLEARSLKKEKLEEQTNAMKDALKEAADFYGGEVVITHSHLYGGYAHSPDSGVLQQFKDACKTLGLAFGTKTTLGGSDANIFNSHGVPTLAISSGYSGAHSTAERIAIADLEALASVTLELMSL
jgi:tripeptide aminopeptidase